MGHALLKRILRDVIPDGFVGRYRNDAHDRFRAVPLNETGA